MELGTELGMAPEDIVLATEANKEVESIYQPVYERDGDEMLLIDQIGGSAGGYPACEEPEKEAVLNKMVIHQLLESLNEQERKLIELRYFENRTQCEAAAELGMSQVQVSRTEKKILLGLRERLM